jgi:AraC family transcriptional regulator of adaptative response/methylated-DNA-[protein]-cysteine methyltransferase
MTDRERWDAVLARDRRARFFFAVTSTRVYCRPSCPARRPKPENVRFFDTPDDARAAGFRACLRCRPDEQPRTPRLPRAAMRLDRFKRAVRGGMSVTDAIYEAGYGSSSRLYEQAAPRLGMTPGQYRRGGAGVAVEFGIAACAVGRVLAARTPKGVCSVRLGADDAGLETSLRQEFPHAELRRGDDSFAERIARHLDSGAACEIPIDVNPTAFQAAVWNILRRIPRGETRTYSGIARELNTGARAVAKACASNPVAGVIPCHRVVREDGHLGGYRWGIERKERLLALEAESAFTAPIPANRPTPAASRPESRSLPARP